MVTCRWYFGCRFCNNGVRNFGLFVSFNRWNVILPGARVVGSDNVHGFRIKNYRIL